MNPNAATLDWIVIAAAKLLAAVGVCMLGLWAWTALASACRFAEVDWTWHGPAVSTLGLCLDDYAVQSVQRDGRECLELYALKDGLPVGERCPRPDAR